MNDIKTWADMITCSKVFDNIGVLAISIPVANTEGVPYVHVNKGIRKLAAALNCDLMRSDWEGNKYCDSDWDVLYFMYNGYRFFQLVPKEF